MTHSQNIKRMLEAVYKKKTSKSGLLRVSRGMQFDRAGVKYVSFLVMFLFVFSIITMINGSLVVGYLLVLPIPFLIAYVLDIRGFEIDFKNDKIRKYQSFLGLRSGDWMPLSAFDSVRVYQETLKTQRGKFIRTGPKTYDTHEYYYVRLVSPGLKKSISLLELDNYGRAKYQADKISKHARLIFIEKPAKLKGEKV